MVGREAVFESLGVGGTAPMKDIEILNDKIDVPTMLLHGEAEIKV